MDSPFDSDCSWLDSTQQNSIASDSYCAFSGSSSWTSDLSASSGFEANQYSGFDCDGDASPGLSEPRGMKRKFSATFSDRDANQMPSPEFSESREMECTFSASASSGHDVNRYSDLSQDASPELPDPRGIKRNFVVFLEDVENYEGDPSFKRHCSPNSDPEPATDEDSSYLTEYGKCLLRVLSQCPNSLPTSYASSGNAERNYTDREMMECLRLWTNM